MEIQFKKALFIFNTIWNENSEVEFPKCSTCSIDRCSNICTRVNVCKPFL